MTTFDTDIDIAAAISKYNIETDNGKLQIRANSESICTIYDDLYDFANQKESIDPYLQSIKNSFSKLFNLSKPHDYNFITVTNNKATPFATDGDILIIVRDNTPRDNTLLVLRVNNEVLIKYCRINPFNQNLKFFKQR
ncbi:S24 family peptidase [Campylobacter concisus]|uniref:S24 family peptidase n=1 Tax=Campylobacter concisus TaxID=199 RepID=UPI001E34F0C5|nr:S24 family peptidase [Campylobacter concisus]